MRILCAYNAKFSEFLPAIKRQNTRLLVGLLTGLWLRASHAFSMDLIGGYKYRKRRKCLEIIE